MRQGLVNDEFHYFLFCCVNAYQMATVERNYRKKLTILNILRKHFYKISIDENLKTKKKI